MPLPPDIAEGGRGHDGEAQEKDVGLRVGERAEAIVVFLASCKRERVKMSSSCNSLW